MTYDWLREIDDKKIAGAVLLDFTSPAILWIKSYLSNRIQRVFFNGSLSNIIWVESGIPQGSCLGPLLF